MEVKLTIDRFEGNKAVLKTEAGDSIIWPKKMLPDQAHEGMVLNFNISDKANIEADKNKLAKQILNEILDTKEKGS